VFGNELFLLDPELIICLVFLLIVWFISTNLGSLISEFLTERQKEILYSKEILLLKNKGILLCEEELLNKNVSNYVCYSVITLDVSDVVTSNITLHPNPDTVLSSSHSLISRLIRARKTTRSSFR